MSDPSHWPGHGYRHPDRPGTAAKYSNLPKRSLTSTTPDMWPTLDFNQPNRSAPVATDQKVEDRVLRSALLVFAGEGFYPGRPCEVTVQLVARIERGWSSRTFRP